MMVSQWSGRVRRNASRLPSLAAAVWVAAATGLSAPPPADVPPAIVDYFFETGCPACARVEHEVFPALHERYAGFFALRRWDIGIASNAIRLAAYQERLGMEANAPVSVVVDYRTALCGVDSIRAGLPAAVDAAIAARLSDDWTPPAPIAIPTREAGLVKAAARVRAFTAATIVVAGLCDGLNPCAIAALVFLTSLLALSNIRGARLLLLGIPYCAASFATYVAIGLGLLKALHLFHGFPMVQWAVETLLIGGLLVAAWLSFRDARRFRASRDPRDVTLQLPPRIKGAVRAVLRRGVRAPYLIVGGLLAGAAVTALDAVCTGQLYLPTLALVLDASDGGGAAPRALALLLAYNAAFILPLVTVFALICAGLRSTRLAAWSAAHVATGKVLIGGVMLLLAVLTALV